MSSILDAWLVSEVLTMSSKYKLNRNSFDNNRFFLSLFFRYFICEGRTGFKKIESFEILLQIQLGTNLGLKFPLIY